jgi:hypothetical protein
VLTTVEGRYQGQRYRHDGDGGDGDIHYRPLAIGTRPARSRSATAAIIALMAFTQRFLARPRALYGATPAIAPDSDKAKHQASQQTTAKISADKQRIEARRGKNIAKVAAARKLLTLVYYGLRDGQIRALDRARAA